MKEVERWKQNNEDYLNISRH